MTPSRPPGQAPADPPENPIETWLTTPNLRLSEADRAECQARCPLKLCRHGRGCSLVQKYSLV